MTIFLIKIHDQFKYSSNLTLFLNSAEMFKLEFVQDIKSITASGSLIKKTKNPWHRTYKKGIDTSAGKNPSSETGM